MKKKYWIGILAIIIVLLAIGAFVAVSFVFSLFFSKYTKYTERIEDLGYSIIEASYLECEHNVANPQDNFEDFLYELRQTETDKVYLDKEVNCLFFTRYEPYEESVYGRVTVFTFWF